MPLRMRSLRAICKARVEFKEKTLGQPTPIWHWVGFNVTNIWTYPKDWNGQATFALGRRGRGGEDNPAQSRSHLLDPGGAGYRCPGAGPGVCPGAWRSGSSGAWTEQNPQSVTYNGQTTAPWPVFVQCGTVGQGYGKLYPVVGLTASSIPDQRCGLYTRFGPTAQLPGYMRCEGRQWNRVRGTATVEQRGTVKLVLDLLPLYRYNYSIQLCSLEAAQLPQWQVQWYLRRWQTVWRAATDNDRPGGAGWAIVTAEGQAVPHPWHRRAT